MTSRTTSLSKATVAALALAAAAASMIATYVSERMHSAALAEGGVCSPYGSAVSAASSQANPDSLMFVTCSGFLE